MNDADSDPTNELQTILKDGQTVTLSNNGGSFTDEVDDADADPENELQTLTQNGLEVTLSLGGGTINVADNDNEPANELQQLNKVGNMVTLSQNGGSFTDEVNDADANPVNELQNLGNSKNGNLVTVSISNGTGTTLDVSDSDANPANELQTFSQNGLEVTLSQGGGTINVADNDNQPTNELQQLIKVGNVVTLSQNGGSFTDEVDDADANSSNELQNLSNTKNGNLIDLDISNGTGTTLDVTDSDADPVNELQVLAQTDYQVTMSQGGGSIMTGVKSYTQTEINAMTPYTGLTVHNVTTNCINYYFNGNWYEACGTCLPQPTQANAGPSQHFTDATTSTILEGNAPNSGTGIWTIISGEGGGFEDATNPTTNFTGTECGNYVLRWSISTSCTTKSDDVSIDYDYQPTLPDAGPDQIGLPGTTTILAGNTPIDGTGIWTIVSGESGSFSDSTSPTSGFTASSNALYTLVWTISTPCNSLSDTVQIRLWNCGNPITDERDGKTYNTVLIGEQCWMAQNLNTGIRIAGISSQTNNGTIEKYCYDNSETECDTFGGLYQWNEMMNYTTTSGVKGICPTGWHVPTDAEWTALISYVSSQPTYLCNNITNYSAKAMAAKTNWNTSIGTCEVGNDLNANNSTNFTWLPSGYSFPGGNFGYKGDQGVFWSSTESGTTDAKYHDIFKNSQMPSNGVYPKVYGWSVRCLRD